MGMGGSPNYRLPRVHTEHLDNREKEYMLNPLPPQHIGHQDNTADPCIFLGVAHLPSSACLAMKGVQGRGEACYCYPLLLLACLLNCTGLLPACTIELHMWVRFTYVSMAH